MMSFLRAFRAAIWAAMLVGLRNSVRDGEGVGRAIVRGMDGSERLRRRNEVVFPRAVSRYGKGRAGGTMARAVPAVEGGDYDGIGVRSRLMMVVKILFTTR